MYQQRTNERHNKTHTHTHRPRARWPSHPLGCSGGRSVPPLALHLYADLTIGTHATIPLVALLLTRRDRDHVLAPAATSRERTTGLLQLCL